ncbi:MAG: arginine--tRNA ligase [Acidobacteria bacterium]|nr:MAG: arginine--tRNA ligase [Acidobacteriota bacterium]
MILSVQRRVHDAIAEAIRQRFGMPDVPPFAVEVPPTRAMGDLAVPVAFQLARTLRKAPRAIAQELAQAVGRTPGVARVEAAPNGYLNLYLDRLAFLVPRLRQQVQPDRAPTEKTIVEHTAINPNKAAHVGHLRNATLGDTLVRALRFRGTPVETQNYIDDMGVQVADIIVGFRELERRTMDEVRQIADSTRFDYYCWDLYSKVSGWNEGDKSRLAVRAAVLHDLEHGGNDTAAMGAFIVDRIVRTHLKTMARLNIGYDLLTYEGDILRLHFWTHAFETLKAQGAVFLQTEGKLAGCWVMRIEDGSAKASAERRDDVEPATDDDESREKVIVRSNGVVTYVGKDLANQFWKFGLLGLDFRYRLFATQADGRPLWSTTSDDGDPGAPPFGHAARIFNVIDSRQMYLQALLSQALRTLGHPTEAENSIHFSYEMVGLSHATARELGYETAAESEEAKKPFVEVAGRKGLGVKIDDLLDLLTAKASAEVARRNPEFTPGDCERVGAQIAVAAIRYFMLKYSRGKLIVFDIEEALSFEGETGPYLQYAVVRANNILNKLQEREGLSEADVLAVLDQTPADEMLGQGDSLEPGEDTLWALVFEASRLDEVVEQVVRSLEFSALAKYTFGLAQTFNAFYHRYPILNEERVDRKRWRAAGVAYVRAQLTRALDLMGIEVPGRM